MIPEEIAKFEQVRVQARSYLCLLLNRTIPNNLPDPNLDIIISNLKIITKERIKVDVLYVLDAKGNQVSPNISANKSIRKIEPDDQHSTRAYYFRTLKDRKCIITNPYPSSLTNELTVTASYPIYNSKRELKFIVCMDISLHDLLKFAQPTSLDTIFSYTSKIIYTMFSVALLAVAFILFFNGIDSIFSYGLDIHEIKIKEMFESTILLTLALAIFDLVKTIFEEEVLGRHDNQSKDIHRTMIKFLGSIIIALSIEALMLVFKFALTNPENIIHAVYLLGGVGVLLFGLSLYLKSTEHRNDKC